MELWNRPLNRILCAEALEGRWLLSAAVSSNTTGAPPDSGDVHVVGEIEPDDGDEGDVEIDASELPASVIAALNAQFPGATIEEAELEEEDGIIEYGVTAKFNGQSLEVTFAASGTITEVEQEVSSNDLPAALREWLERKYPGAVVDEAAIITSAATPTYELTFAQPGEQPLEATVEVDDASAADPAVPTAPPELTSVSFSDAAVADPAIDAATPVESDPATAPAEQIQADATVDIEADDAAQRRERTDAASLPAWLIEAGQAGVAEALASLAAGAGAAVWLPEFADIMSEVLPIDVTSVERGIQHVLSEIDKLAQQALADTTPSGAAMRLSIVVALVAGVQLLLLDRKLRKGGPVRVFSAKNSSWSWVVGTVVPVRVRRVNYFRRQLTMTIDSLDDLLEKLNGGDDDAAEQAFVAYEPYLRKVVRRLLPAELRSKFDSIDVVQSVYGDVLVAFRAGGMRFGSVTQLRAFLIKATRNRFIDRVRQNQTAARLEQPIGAGEADRMPKSRRPRPSESAEAEELWERLLAMCPPEHHQLLKLRRRGATASEIAARVGMHEGSVRRVLRELSIRLACESPAA